MKEGAAAVLVRHDIDRPAWASSASSESGSLELLLSLDASVGAAILRPETVLGFQLPDLFASAERSPVEELVSQALASGFLAATMRARAQDAAAKGAGAVECARARGRVQDSECPKGSY